MTDYIHIRDLSVDCIIGTRERERVEKQTVVFNIRLACDTAAAAASDRIEDAVDYVVLKNQIVEDVAASQHFLLERLVARVADLCLTRPGVKAVRVTVDKPGALTGARSVAVEIERRRG